MRWRDSADREELGGFVAEGNPIKEAAPSENVKEEANYYIINIPMHGWSHQDLTPVCCRIDTD
jgi:hypothetical protein